MCEQHQPFRKELFLWMALAVFIWTDCSYGFIATQSSCLVCHGTTSLKQCRSQQCLAQQECFIQEYRDPNGTDRFYAGCVNIRTCLASVHPEFHYTSPGLPTRQGTQLCFRCCGKHMCNDHTCRNDVHRYKHCYTCSNARTLGDCQELRRCPYEHMECYLQVYQQIDGSPAYHGGCGSYMQCGALSHPNTNHNPASSLPLQTGSKLCEACCSSDRCNKAICKSVHFKPKTTITTPPTSISTTTTATTEQGRLCYKCSDIRLDSHGKWQQCTDLVTCQTKTSKCSSVIRIENDILTMDTGCAENLNCDVTGDPSFVCGKCCDGDVCNDALDCRMGATGTPSLGSLSSTANTLPVSSVSSSVTSSVMSLVTSSTASLFTSVSTAQRPLSLKAVECHICSGPTCGISPDSDNKIKCIDNLAPFCVNKITNDENGNKHVTKRCGNVEECNGSINSTVHSQCTNFDPSQIYTTSFECTFCCVLPNCNRAVIPESGSMHTLHYSVN